MKYYIVDVFAQEKYNGNQLAVFMDIGTIRSRPYIFINGFKSNLRSRLLQLDKNLKRTS